MVVSRVGTRPKTMQGAYAYAMEYQPSGPPRPRIAPTTVSDMSLQSGDILMTKENSKVKPDATADKASPRTPTSKYKGKCIACGARGHWIGEC